MTAILTLLGATFNYRCSSRQSQGTDVKNIPILIKNEVAQFPKPATNQWFFCHAKCTEKNLS